MKWESSLSGRAGGWCLMGRQPSRLAGDRGKEFSPHPFVFSWRFFTAPLLPWRQLPGQGCGGGTQPKRVGHVPWCRDGPPSSAPRCRRPSSLSASATFPTILPPWFTLCIPSLPTCLLPLPPPVRIRSSKLHLAADLTHLVPLPLLSAPPPRCLHFCPHSAANDPLHYPPHAPPRMCRPPRQPPAAAPRPPRSPAAAAAAPTQLPYLPSLASTSPTTCRRIPPRPGCPPRLDVV